MIMLKPDIFDWFNVLSNNPHFLNTISISDRLIEEQYNTELVLRFVALLKYNYDNTKDLGDYLDDINENILTAEDLDLNNERVRFQSTFEFLNSTLGERAFKKYDDGRFKGKFLESAFECIGVGLAHNIEQWDIQNDQGLLEQRIQTLYHQAPFIDNVGSGSNARTRIPRIVPFGKQFFTK
jgi:hypothetical protein